MVEKKEEGSSAVYRIIGRKVVVQYLALMTTKVFIACVWTFGCCKQPTSTTGSIMVWLKRRLYSCQLLLVLDLTISVESASTKIL